MAQRKSREDWRVGGTEKELGRLESWWHRERAGKIGELVAQRKSREDWRVGGTEKEQGRLESWWHRERALALISQDPNTQKVQKNTIYWDKTQHAKDPIFIFMYRCVVSKRSEVLRKFEWSLPDGKSAATVLHHPDLSLVSIPAA